MMDIGFGMNPSYLDIPRIYSAIAEWGACLVYCLVLPRSKKLPAFCVISAVSLVIQCVFMHVTGGSALFLWLPFMLVAFALMYLYIYLCTDISRRKKIYYALRAFLLAEFAASLAWQLIYFAEFTLERSEVKRAMVVLTIYAAAGFATYHIEREMTRDGYDMEVSKRDIFSTLLITLFTFSFSNLSFLLPNTPFSATIREDILYVRTIVDFGGMAVLYAFQSRITELQRAGELAAIQKELTSQYDGYRNYQEMISLINFKYHDLKHQVMGLMAEGDIDARREALQTMQRDLENYRPEHMTGNQVLDTILAGKSMAMKQTDIRFTCVADGGLLSNMHVSDICSIFGNALDNAIECESMLPNPENRLIHLTLAERQGFIFIELENYCEEEVRIEKGLPVTTKKDKGMHGYGVKSIAYSVAKYGGSVTFKQRDNKFTMQILIPRT